MRGYTSLEKPHEAERERVKMSQFCHECGQQMKKDNVVCTNCGTPLQKEAVVSKQPMSKKHKADVWNDCGDGGPLNWFHCLGKYAFFRRQTSEKFADAISDKDAKVLQSLVVHEDGSTIDIQEANAMLKLVKVEGLETVQTLITIQQHGKVLGLSQNTEWK